MVSPAHPSRELRRSAVSAVGVLPRLHQVDPGGDPLHQAAFCADSVVALRAGFAELAEALKPVARKA